MNYHYKAFSPTLTVEKFQNIVRHAATIDADKLDEMDKISDLYCMIFNISREDFDELTLAEVKQMAKAMNKLLLLDIPGKPKRHLTIDGKRFIIQYDPAKLQSKATKQLVQYANDPIGNLHLFLATIAAPVEYGFKYWKTGFKRPRKKTAQDHADISKLMLQAPLTDVYATCYFFCRQFLAIMKMLRPQLKAEMIATGTPADVADSMIDSGESSLKNFFDHSVSQPVHPFNIN